MSLHRRMSRSSAATRSARTGTTFGSFSWAGHWGTYFRIDPAEQLIGLQMVQATPGSKARKALLPAGINHLVYDALMGRALAAP